MAYATPDIPNSVLKLSDIPSPQADWSVICKFALTFDGYKHWGSSEKCREIARHRPDGTLTELRTCLFLEQRRWRWFELEPDEETLAYIHGVIEKIRAKVTAEALA
jgi:hypothetical protein